MYEAQRAERQYQTVEPENRLVARSLEARWEAALEQQRAAQDALDRFQREKPVELTAMERRSLEELSHDIPALWNAPETTARERQEIVRCLIERVAITVSAEEQQVDVLIRWAGGFESRHDSAPSGLGLRATRRFRAIAGPHRRAAPGRLAVAADRRAAQRGRLPDAETTWGIHGRCGPRAVSACGVRHAATKWNRPATTAVVGGRAGAAVEDPSQEAERLGTMRLGTGNRATVWRRVDSSR